MAFARRRRLGVGTSEIQIRERGKEGKRERREGGKGRGKEEKELVFRSAFFSLPLLLQERNPFSLGAFLPAYKPTDPCVHRATMTTAASISYGVVSGSGVVLSLPHSTGLQSSCVPDLERCTDALPPPAA